MGIEPTYSAWKAEVLPLNYTRAAKRRVAHHSAINPIHPEEKSGHRPSGPSRPARRSKPLRGLVEPLIGSPPPPLHTEREGCLAYRSLRPLVPTSPGGGGRITPGLRPSALRAVAPCATFETALRFRRTSYRFASSPSNYRAGGMSGLSVTSTACPDFTWWRGEDSNLRRRSRQIYSLIPLATREPLQARAGHSDASPPQSQYNILKIFRSKR